jgi:glutamyl-tRNA reductase
LAGVEVRAVDDLRLVVERALMLRRARLPAAHAIVAADVALYTRCLSRSPARALGTEKRVPGTRL